MTTQTATAVKPQHNCQANDLTERGKIPACVAERCYEVYSHIWGDRQSLARLNERGGFGTGEMIAYLYAYPFPKDEWRARSHEATP
jgi:hypothetical protein